jgi:hypothetical protein
MEIAMKKLVVLTALAVGLSASGAYADYKGGDKGGKSGNSVKVTVVSVGNGSVGYRSNNTGIQSGGVANFNGANVTNISGNVGR